MQFEKHIARACGGPCDGMEEELKKLPHPMWVVWATPLPPEPVKRGTKNGVEWMEFAPVEAVTYKFDRIQEHADGPTVYLYQFDPEANRKPASDTGIPDTFPEDWVGQSMPQILLKAAES